MVDDPHQHQHDDDHDHPPTVPSATHGWRLHTPSLQLCRQKSHLLGTHSEESPRHPPVNPAHVDANGTWGWRRRRRNVAGGCRYRLCLCLWGMWGAAEWIRRGWSWEYCYALWWWHKKARFALSLCQLGLRCGTSPIQLWSLLPLAPGLLFPGSPHLQQ